MFCTGDKLGPYEILEPIGKGSMGEVYRARDSRVDRHVATPSLEIPTVRGVLFQSCREKEEK